MEVDKEIILGCKRGDRRAQFRLYELFYPYMMSISLRYSREQDQAASTVNAAFLKILNNINSYDQGQPMKGWIRRILINTTIDEFRKSKRNDRLMANVDYDKEVAVNGIYLEYNEAESHFNVEVLTKCIHELNPLTGNVFNLFVMEGFSHKEIGEMLEITEAASKWHLFTARKQLQEKIIQMQSNSNQLFVTKIKSLNYEK